MSHITMLIPQGIQLPQVLLDLRTMDDCGHTFTAISRITPHERILSRSDVLIIVGTDSDDISELLLRAKEHTPVSSVVIVYDEELNDDKHVSYLSYGADYCPNASCTQGILMTRIFALCRKPAKKTVLRSEEMLLDIDTNTLHVDSKIITLGEYQTAYLSVLLRRPRIIHSRREIMEELKMYDIYHRTIDSAYMNIKRKIGRMKGSTPAIITKIWCRILCPIAQTADQNGLRFFIAPYSCKALDCFRYEAGK